MLHFSGCPNKTKDAADTSVSYKIFININIHHFANKFLSKIKFNYSMKSTIEIINNKSQDTENKRHSQETELKI